MLWLFTIRLFLNWENICTLLQNTLLKTHYFSVHFWRRKTHLIVPNLLFHQFVKYTLLQNTLKHTLIWRRFCLQNLSILKSCCSDCSQFVSIGKYTLLQNTLKHTFWKCTFEEKNKNHLKYFIKLSNSLSQVPPWLFIIFWKYTLFQNTHFFKVQLWRRKAHLNSF